MARESPWNRCDVCGRFIPIADFESGAAARDFRLVYDWWALDVVEKYETLCATHNTRKPLPAESPAGGNGAPDRAIGADDETGDQT